MDEAVAPGERLCECGDPSCPGGVPIRSPFYYRAEEADDGAEGLQFFLTARTTSWEWSGERTDLHDMFALLWAANLRVREIASVQLVSVLNQFVGSDTEIYAQVLVLRQTGAFRSDLPVRSRFQMLGDESVRANALVRDVFGVDSRGAGELLRAAATYKPEPEWVEKVRRRLRLGAFEGYEFRKRDGIGWSVFTSLARGVSIGEFGEAATSRLKQAFAEFRPLTAAGTERLAFKTDRLVNAVPLKTIRKAEGLLSLVENAADPPLLIPIETALIAIGTHALVAVAADCGAEAFADERLQIQQRQREQAEVFFDDVRFVWAAAIDDGRFEELVRALLEREKGVHRVRQVGGTREADDGRDFMVDWSVGPPRGAGVTRERGGELYLSEPREVLVQVKVRQSGVGRSHLPGLRDTLEHYGSGGLLVVAYPRITATLFDHLRALRLRGEWWVDWWGKAELELKLRANPGIVGQFPDLVRIAHD